MTTVAEQVKDIAYDNDLQAGVIAADESGNPLAVIIGQPDILTEVAGILKADHETRNTEPVQSYDPPTVPVEKKPNFFRRLFGMTS